MAPDQKQTTRPGIVSWDVGHVLHENQPAYEVCIVLISESLAAEWVRHLKRTAPGVGSWAREFNDEH